MSKRSDAFTALADPTRRGILELLRDGGPHAAGAIAARFPRISRPAVSRHLRVLRESRLVRAREIGREWQYEIDANTLARLQREWFAPFEPLWDESLRRLKRRAESTD